MTTNPTAPEVRALVLDLDDTLIDTRAAMVSAGSTVAARLWPDAGDELHARFGREYFADPADYYRRYADGVMTFDAMRRHRFDDALRSLDLPAVQDGYTAFETGWQEAFGTLQRMFDDTTDLLDAADRGGLPMVLLTNSSGDSTEMKLAAVGLADRFAKVLHTDVLGVGKPDRRLFDMAVQAAGRPASTVLSVGDNLGRDVIGAIDAGLQAAWLHRPTDESITDEEVATARRAGVRTVSSLGEVVALL